MNHRLLRADELTRRRFIARTASSLLGVELGEPDLSQRAFALNFTNEGGVDGTYRLLKNIMGLWLVQECRRSFAKDGGTSDYAALVRAAESAPAFRSLIQPDDTVFLNPSDMPAAIAQLQQDATLNVFTMWGGISIRVPQDWTVMSQGVPLLGGIDDKTVPPAMPGKRLVIQRYAIMGGVEIKN